MFKYMIGMYKREFVDFFLLASINSCSLKTYEFVKAIPYLKCSPKITKSNNKSISLIPNAEINKLSER